MPSVKLPDIPFDPLAPEPPAGEAIAAPLTGRRPAKVRARGMGAA